MKASITESLLEDAQLGPAKNSLRELKQLSLETYTDVREAIFNLRTTLASGLRFLPTLEVYLSEYRFHYGLDVQLSVDGIDLSLFPPDVDIQLLRIVQEALTNVRKHARAAHVWIRFTGVKQGEWVEIMIEDDGCGFEPHSIQSAMTVSIGLQIMRERAESVGGRLELDSKPGGGTRVIVRIPCPEQVRKEAL